MSGGAFTSFSARLVHKLSLPHLVPKLCLGTQAALKALLLVKSGYATKREAGASDAGAFPSWRLGTRKRENFKK